MRKIIFVLLYGILWGSTPLKGAETCSGYQTQCNATSDAKSVLMVCLFTLVLIHFVSKSGPTAVYQL